MPASPYWISYGNGPRNWFTNRAETKLGVENASQLVEKWRITPGEVTGTPSIIGDRAYVVTSRGTIAINPDTGESLWPAPTPASGTTAPAYDDASKTLFVGDRSGNLYSIDAMTGMVKWMKRVGMGLNAGFCPPVLSGNRVIIGVSGVPNGSSFKGALVAFDKDTGMQLWSYTTVTTGAGAGVWGGASVDEESGFVYAGTSQSYRIADDRSDSIFALDVMKGEFQWNMQGLANDAFTLDGGRGPDFDFGTSPILFEHSGRKLLAAGQKSGEFWLLDRMTGEKIWSNKLTDSATAANGGILNNGAFDGERLIVVVNHGTTPGKVVAFDPNPAGDGTGKGKILWEQPATGLSWAPITTANGVCFNASNTSLEVRKCATGELVKTFAGAGTVGGAAAISEGRVIFGSGFSYPFGAQAGNTLIGLGLP